MGKFPSPVENHCTWQCRARLYHALSISQPHKTTHTKRLPLQESPCEPASSFEWCGVQTASIWAKYVPTYRVCLLASSWHTDSVSSAWPFRCPVATFRCVSPTSVHARCAWIDGPMVSESRSCAVKQNYRFDDGYVKVYAMGWLLSDCRFRIRSHIYMYVYLM